MKGKTILAEVDGRGRPVRLQHRGGMVQVVAVLEAVGGGGMLVARRGSAAGVSGADGGRGGVGGAWGGRGVEGGEGDGLGIPDSGFWIHKTGACSLPYALALTPPGLLSKKRKGERGRRGVRSGAS